MPTALQRAIRCANAALPPGLVPKFSYQLAKCARCMRVSTGTVQSGARQRSPVASKLARTPCSAVLDTYGSGLWAPPAQLHAAKN